jgi:GT2 family glycosyltransferase
MKNLSSKKLISSMVSVIIPTYNRSDKLIKCLDSIFKSTYKNIEVIVINDYLKIDLKPLLKEFKIRLIQPKREIYVVESRNLGAKIAKGKILFFVDDDNILDKNAMENLVSKYLSIKNAGLIGPLMYSSSGNLWFCGGKATWINPNITLVPETELKKELIETDAIPNAYMTSKKLYLKIGGEDPNFPTHEELDLAQRIKFAGYKNYIYTKAVTIHDIGKVKINLMDRPPYRMYITVKCNFLIEKKYAPKFKFLLFLFGFMPLHMSLYLLYYIPFKAKNKREYYKAYLRGLRDGISRII